MAIESDVQCSIVYSHGTMSLFTYEHISNSIHQYTSLIMTRATRSLGIKKASSHGPGSIPAGYMTVFVMHALCT